MTYQYKDSDGISQFANAGNGFFSTWSCFLLTIGLYINNASPETTDEIDHASKGGLESASGISGPGVASEEAVTVEVEAKAEETGPPEEEAGDNEIEM